MSDYIKRGSIIIDDLVPTPEKTEEEWVWVTGYKGTDKDMKCMNDFQYELGKRYDMLDGEPVSMCSSGFHLCLELRDVFNYFELGKNNRFFEARALVRKDDVDRYGKASAWAIFGSGKGTYDKLVAKSIELTRELTSDEILATYPDTQKWSEDLKQLAIAKDYKTAEKEFRTEELQRMGYVESLARYIVNNYDTSGYDLAVALNDQPGISMDTKINAIFSHI